MSEERNVIRRVLDGLYASVQNALDNSSKSFEEVLKAKADALGNGPEHTLAYYENLQVDPLRGLSSRDFNQIELWMKASENLSVDDGIDTLSDRDKADIERWMQRSENLPLELESTSGILDSFVEAWDDLCGRKYMRDLETLEKRERAAKAAKRNRA